MNNNFIFLTNDQILGENKLDIFKKYGHKAAISDFSILLGGCVSNGYHTGEENKLENRTGWYWTSSDDEYDDTGWVCVVDVDGSDYYCDVTIRSGGARPALTFSSIQDIPSNEVRGQSGVLEIEYGEYPQKAASKEVQILLEKAYKSGSLKSTGKKYTTDPRKYSEYDKGFLPCKHIEYEYNGKKYVRIKANSCYGKQSFQLSNGKKYTNRNFVWVEVSPIKWLVDERKHIMITKDIIFAGIQFNELKNYKGDRNNYKGDFNSTNIKQFLNDYFSKEIISSTKFEFQMNQIQDRIRQKEKQLEKLKQLKSKLLDLYKYEQNLDDQIEQTLKEINKSKTKTKKK